jgi:hypothetical protein
VGSARCRHASAIGRCCMLCTVLAGTALLQQLQPRPRSAAAAAVVEGCRRVPTHHTTPYAPRPMGLMGAYLAGHSNRLPQTCCVVAAGARGELTPLRMADRCARLPPGWQTTHPAARRNANSGAGGHLLSQQRSHVFLPGTPLTMNWLYSLLYTSSEWDTSAGGAPEAAATADAADGGALAPSKPAELLAVPLLPSTIGESTMALIIMRSERCEAYNGLSRFH